MFSRRSGYWLPRTSSRFLHLFPQPHERPVDAIPSVRERARSKIAAIERVRPHAQALLDSFHRRHDYLRISLTERCNLRCFYCMPSEGIELSPSENILSDDEIVRLAFLFIRNGVNKIRLTGGEPTVRKGLIDLVGRLNELRPYGLKSIAMTTNGAALHRKLPALVENGLTHLNLSLDTLEPFKFELMTRRAGHDAVLRCLELALNTDRLQSVKLNVVVIRGLNDNEVLKFIELTKEKPLSVRFIEFMPFNGNKWDKQKMIPSSALLDRISAVHPGVHRLSDELNDTARSYRVPGYRGSFGFISSMSNHFCGSCNRLRLTADGQVKVCLFDSREVSLRDLVRQGASDEELIAVIRAALLLKKEKHDGMEDIDVLNNRPMIKIGDKFRMRVMGFHRHSPLASAYTSPCLCSLRHKTHQPAALYHSLAKASEDRLTHIDKQGKPAMVDVSNKDVTLRSATAEGRIFIPKNAFVLIHNSQGRVQTAGEDPEANRLQEKSKAKGDVLTVAQLAGIIASKKTSELIPLCHSIPLTHVSVELIPEDHSVSKDSLEDDWRYSILCRATVASDGKTGVEMEALTAVSVSLLTIWDMLKAVAGKQMLIEGICVISKSGGMSGDFVRMNVRTRE